MFSLIGATTGRIALTALAAVVLLAGVFVPGSGAAEAPAEPLDPAAPATAVDLVRANREFEQADRQLAVVQQRLAFAQGLLADTTNQLAVNTARLADVRQRVRERAAVVYQRSGSGNLGALNVPSVGDLDSGSQYARVALSVDDTQLRALSGVVGSLQQLHQQQSQGASQLEQSQTDLQQSEQELADRRARDQALLDRWGAVPVMGQSALSGPQLAAWFKSTGAVPRLAPGTTIDDLAQLYVVEGGLEGVRGDLAFAQAVIETGYFSVAAGNNYAGIGVCDSCTGGYRFPTPLDGVRAVDPTPAELRRPGQPRGQAREPTGAGVVRTGPAEGRIPVRLVLAEGPRPALEPDGRGNWATDPVYAGKVTGLFRKMLAFASTNPAA